MNDFRAYRIRLEQGRIAAAFERMTIEDLTPGEVVIRVRYSGINFKDALAATGAGRILRKYPLNAGIDLSGEVHASSDARFTPGDAVLVTGNNLSETVDGGYAEFARVGGDSVIPLPAGLDLREAMIIGTAGFTAGLAVHRMEHNGQRPDKGPIVVTGASGGVGSIAVNMLAGRGYEVAAVSSKPQADEFLRDLGAARILRPQEIDPGSKPLEAAVWAGAVDNVGGELLTWITRTMGYEGNIASIGLAASPELKTTVMPFILRGVNLLGINSVLTPRDVRLEVWKRIASDLRPAKLDRICTKTVEFDALPAQFDDYIKGRVIGRTLVRIS
jgi:NADPH2:quinone reductase